MPKPDKKAVERLAAARKHLQEVQTSKRSSDPKQAKKDYEDANRKVLDAEKGVRFGVMRGWKY